MNYVYPGVSSYQREYRSSSEDFNSSQIFRSDSQIEGTYSVQSINQQTDDYHNQSQERSQNSDLEYQNTNQRQFNTDDGSSNSNFFEFITYSSIKTSQEVTQQNTQQNQLAVIKQQKYTGELSINEQKQINKKRKIILQEMYNSLFIQKSNIVATKKMFYLFLDQIIDIDYFKNYENKENYLQERKLVQLNKGLRFINQVTHRIDNKYIEVDVEFFPSEITNIEYLTKILQSYGNKDILQVINNLQIFWDNVKLCKSLIQSQSQDPIFIQHRENRKKASLEKFQEITTQLSQTEMIFYLRISVNYDKISYESDKIGYSPELYEFLDINSYSFKDLLQRNGHYDPRIFFNYENCHRTVLFMLSPPSSTAHDSKIDKDYISTKIQIKTCDNFIFPVEQRLRQYVLTGDYDKEHNLNFRLKDYLFTQEFVFEDPNIKQEFKKFRQQQLEDQQIVTVYNENQFHNQNFDYQKTEFFNKYYYDQIDNLLAKGNKWFKRCGYIDIPHKKNKNKFQDE